MKIEIPDNILSEKDLFNIQIKGFEEDWQNNKYSAFNRYNSMKVDGKDIYPNPNLNYRNKDLEFIIKHKDDEIKALEDEIKKLKNINSNDYRNKDLEFIINKGKCDEIISTINNIFKDQNIYNVSIKVEEFGLDSYLLDYIYKSTNGDISVNRDNFERKIFITASRGKNTKSIFSSGSLSANIGKK